MLKVSQECRIEPIRVWSGSELSGKREESFFYRSPENNFYMNKYVDIRSNRVFSVESIKIFLIYILVITLNCKTS
jgi:hypothetical protein